MKIYLFETTAVINGSGDTIPIRLSTGLGYAHPSAAGFYSGRIGASDNSVSVQRSIFESANFGGGSLGFGSVDVVATGGTIDAWLEYGFGREATLKLGDDAENISAFVTVLKARVGGLSPAQDKFSLAWEGRTKELEEPASPAVFAGTNSGSTGLEGLATDIKGQRKPRAAGVLKSISPVLVNSSQRIFAWHYDKAGNRAATHSVDSVRYRGAAWTFGVDHANAAALQAATPTQGVYDTCKAESLIKMGGSSALSGAVTMDVTIEATASARYAGALMQAWLLDAGVDSGDIDAPSVTALNEAAPYEAGIYVRDESYQEVLNALAASVAVCYAPDRLGVYRLHRVAAASGVPAVTARRFGVGGAAQVDDADIVSITPVTSVLSVPVKEVKVRYARNWTQMSDTDIADAVAAADRAALVEEWRTTDPHTDAGVATQYSNAKTMSFDCLLAHQADAEAMRSVFAGIFCHQMREWQVSLKINPQVAAALELGSVMQVVHPRFGMSGGKLFRVHGIRLRDRAGIADVRLWG